MKKSYTSIWLVTLLMLVLLAGNALANVGYLGPAGTYTEEATIKYFGEKATITPVKTVQDSLQQLKSGKFTYAVVPVENTIGGPVYNYLDAVIGDPDFVIVGEINLPIRQTLLALKGATLQDIKTVLSHPQGIAQSREWLKANLPGVKVAEVSSTAEGARKVAAMNDKSIAAIAASRTAHVYNLNILANDLQYTHTNVTRFWVVTLKKNQTFGSDKTAMLVKGPVAELPKLLYDLNRSGYALAVLHDRAAKTKLGEYKFIIELSGNGQQAKLAKVLAKHSPAMAVRTLGVYNSK